MTHDKNTCTLLILMTLYSVGCCGQIKQAAQIHGASTLIVAATIDQAARVIDCGALPEALAKRNSCIVAIRAISEQTAALRQAAAELGAAAGPAVKPKASKPAVPSPASSAPLAPASPAPGPLPAVAPAPVVPPAAPAAPLAAPVHP